MALASSTHASDANGETPTSALGVELTSSYLTKRAHFEIYYNTPDVDPNEGRYQGRSIFAAICLECAWMLYIDPSMSDYPFKNPMGSLHYEFSQTTNIPLWVHASCCKPCTVECLGPANGGSSRPRALLSPGGGLIGCDLCDPADLPPNSLGFDPVAFHEFAHVLFKGYNTFLTRAPWVF